MEKNRVYWLLILMMIGSCGARLPSDRQVFKLSVFYDMTYGHVKDITAYSTEIINRQLGTLHNFEFEVSLVLVEDSQSYKLSRTGNLVTMDKDFFPLLNELLIGYVTIMNLSGTI